MNAWLEITLKSDLCAATGESQAGLVDIEIAEDCGFPVIPAKRIKGSLLNAGKELLGNGILEDGVLERVFGMSGSDRGGALHLSDGVMYKIPECWFGDADKTAYLILDDFEKEKRKAAAMISMSREEILELFTSTRTRTALEEGTGTADKGTLRTMRVARKGLVMRCKVEMDTSSKEEEEVLEMCVKDLRHLGMGITRGFGEVSCRLVKAEIKEKVFSRKPFSFASEGLVEQPFTVELKAPLLLSGRQGLSCDCADWINGNTIKGALAAMYIQDYNLGQKAHEDPVFKRIFLRDGVTFGFAFPKYGERVFHPCPAYLAKVKNVNACVNRFDEENNKIRVTSIASPVCASSHEVYSHSPAKSARLHHARPVDRGIGHALADRAKTAEEGMGRFYQYTSLEKGQFFAGSWRGREGDINRLKHCLEQRHMRLRLGRSRTAEYGSAEISFQEIQTVGTSGHTGCRRWLLHLVSPMILLNREKARAEADPEHLCKIMSAALNCGVHMVNERTILKYARVGGYQSKWRLPTPQKPALEAGSILGLEMDREISRDMLESRLWGEMTGEGYGEIKAVPCDEVESIRQMEIIEAQQISEEKDEKSGLCIALENYWKNREERQKDYMEAMNALEQCKNLPNATSISQMIGLFRRLPEKTYEKLEEEAKLIRNPDKKDTVLSFLKVCKGKSSIFIESYLENAKWKARERGR